jgi:hypothetical protein
MLFLRNGEPFATGVMDYEFHPIAPSDVNLRVILRITVENIPALAVLDTGGPYLIIAPAVADRLGFDSNSSLRNTSIKIQGVKFYGNLHRAYVTLTAKDGASITFQPTAFIPDADQEEKWGNLPTFLGIENCLDRVRFALDPDPDEPKFYFGALP